MPSEPAYMVVIPVSVIVSIARVRANFISSVPEHLAVWSSSIYYSQCLPKARKTIKSFFRDLVPVGPVSADAKCYTHIELPPDTNRSRGGTRALFSSGLYLTETYKKKDVQPSPDEKLRLSVFYLPLPCSLD